MDGKQPVSDWRAYIQPALISKVEELRLMGYTNATWKDVWGCLQKKVWKKDRELSLHQVVQDVLHLPSGTYLSYITTNAYADDDLASSIAALMGKE